MPSIEPFLARTHIAYFSMEIAIRPEIHTYSGGLGILAGDTARSCADLELPVVFVSLLSRSGYFRQQIEADGRQTEQPDWWEVERWCTPLNAMVAVEIERKPVWIRPWLYIHTCPHGRQIPILLLDTQLDQNGENDRTLTHYLYGDGDAYRLKQEIILGIGGIRLLRALGFDIHTYHLNEGHAALLTLDLLNHWRIAAQDLAPDEPPYDVAEVRSRCVFTTHTPVEAGHDKFPYDMVGRILGDYVDVGTLRSLSDPNVLNMTKLALALSKYVNGVAERHAETSRRLFPGQRLHSITNGVHPYTWTGARFAALYDQWTPGWRHEPQLLVRADRIPDEAIWAAHQEQKGALVDWIRTRTGVELRLDRPTLGFARRMTEYKRPDLLFADIERLRRIARRRPFQLVLAGKAHPSDEPGKRLIALVHARLRELRDDVTAAYLPDYNMDVAFRLVGGTDVWLNTPLKPLEASGTSGMKAAFNAVPSLSILDGWWVEGCIEGVNGWAIDDPADAGAGRDQESLYRKLADVVLPLYYENRPAWIGVMKGAIAKSASYFDSHRMMRRYVTEAYLR